MEEDSQRLRKPDRRASLGPHHAAPCPEFVTILQCLHQLRPELCCQAGERGARWSEKGQCLYPPEHHIRTGKGTQAQRWDFCPLINGEVSKIKSLLPEISRSDTFVSGKGP